MLPIIHLMRACYGGTETMRQMGELFLPRHFSETEARWKDRLNATTCFNKLREAVETASAKPFKNLLTVNNADDEFNEWMIDADLQGHHLHLVGHKFFNEAVLNSISHILVDHPSTAQLPNLAVQRQMKVRPFMRPVLAEDMLACYKERIGGRTQISHARIASRRVAFDRTTYREVVFDQVFIIERGIVQLWERPASATSSTESVAYLSDGGSISTNNELQNRYTRVEEAGSWRQVYERVVDIPEVPIVTMVAGDERDDLQARPIFLDLAYKQMEHFRSSSDQRSILTASRFPMLACSGINLDTDVGDDGQPAFDIGPYKILNSPDPNGRWYYIETNGNAIAAGQKDLEELSMQMDQLSLNPIINQPGRQYVAQNERSITESRVNTVIHDLAIVAKDALQRAIDFMGTWSDKDVSKVTLNMNFDFSGTDEKARSIASILQAMAAKSISRESGLHELKRLNLLSDEFDIDKEMKASEADMVAPTPVVTDVRSKSERDVTTTSGGTRPSNQA